MKVKELLQKKLTKKELELLPSSFDVVGDILIFNEFPQELEKKEKIIGQTILQNFKNIKVVSKKIKKYSGKYRLPKIKIIAGERRKETIHKESGVRLKLHVEKCYFSTRSAHERLRLRDLVKKEESVLVMFSGIGVIPLIISRNVKDVVGVEWNPSAHDYALENKTLNKGTNITLLQGDVREIIPSVKKKFDRIIMPLPKEAELFLDVALKALKKGGWINFYTFMSDEQIIHAKEFLKEYVPKFKELKIVLCGEYAPGIHRVCLDFRPSL